MNLKILKNIKLIVLDYDRTVTDINLKFDFRLVRPVQNLRKRGIKFALVTGRVWEDIYFLNSYFDIIGYENGAIISYKNNRWYENSNHTKDLKRILELNNIEFTSGQIVLSLPLERFETVKSLILNYKNVIDYIQNRGCVMILPKSVNKGSCLTKMLNILNIPKTAVAVVGDGENDIPMFKIAAYKICLKNSVSQLQEIADICIDKPASAGTLEFLNSMLQIWGD